MTTEKFNPNPPAKLRFQESSDNISKHQKMIALGEFQRAIDFSLLEHNRTLAEGATDMNKAAVAGIKMQGVQEFIIILKYLAEKPLPFTGIHVADNLPGDEIQRRQ